MPSTSNASSQFVTLREWEILTPAQEPHLRITTLSSKLQQRIADLNREKRVEIMILRDGLRVKASSWVGTIPLGDIVLSIQPKIASKDIPTFLRYALGLNVNQLSSRSPAPLQESGFLDLLALALLDEVDALLRSGLFQDYRETRASLTMPRGALLFGEMARHPSFTRLSAPCRFSRRTPELALNQFVVATIGAIRPQVEDRKIQFELHSREAMLSELCGRLPISHELLEEAKAALDRRTSYYAPVLRLCEFLLRGFGSAFDEQESELLSALLFDMNVLFERFVARLCHDYAPRDLKSDVQESRQTAYRYVSNPHRWQLPRLRPDIVVRRRSDDATSPPLIIIDTKYKVLGINRPSPSDLYQLTLYSLAFGSSKPVPARLVFPCLTSSSHLNPAPQLQFVGLGSPQTPASVDLFGLSLPEVAEAIRSRNNKALIQIVNSLLCVTS